MIFFFPFCQHIVIKMAFESVNIDLPLEVQQFIYFSKLLFYTHQFKVRLNGDTLSKHQFLSMTFIVTFCYVRYMFMFRYQKQICSTVKFHINDMGKILLMWKYFTLFYVIHLLCNIFLILDYKNI